MSRMLRLKWVVLAAMLWLPAGAQAHTHHAAQNAHADLAIISVAELPPQARDTLHAIKDSGPFAYPRDGVVFSNFEGGIAETPARLLSRVHRENAGHA